MRRPVILPQNIVKTSRAYGHAIVRWYADNPDAAVRAGTWGAELDPERQGHGKAGEYAVAQYCGLPPTAVRADVGNGADKGKDLVAYGKRIDAKCTPTRKKWLLWSQAVNDLYWSKEFDVIVSVSIDDHDWSRCWIEGWLTKQEFFDYKQIADGVNDKGKLSRGTWFVPKQPLPDVITLRAGHAGYDHLGRWHAYCRCGASAPFGDGCFSVRWAQYGKWYCREHRPPQGGAPAAGV